MNGCTCKTNVRSMHISKCSESCVDYWSTLSINFVSINLLLKLKIEFTLRKCANVCVCARLFKNGESETSWLPTFKCRNKFENWKIPFQLFWNGLRKTNENLRKMMLKSEKYAPNCAYAYANVKTTFEHDWWCASIIHQINNGFSTIKSTVILRMFGKDKSKIQNKWNNEMKFIFLVCMLSGPHASLQITCNTLKVIYVCSSLVVTTSMLAFIRIQADSLDQATSKSSLSEHMDKNRKIARSVSPTLHHQTDEASSQLNTAYHGLCVNVFRILWFIIHSMNRSYS